MLVIIRNKGNVSFIFSPPIKRVENKTRCPELETGKISVIPWMTPNITYLINSIM